MKIHVTGNAGSGKSTISKEISEIFALPLYGLDEIVWKENWVKTPAPERKSKILKITNKSSWVIDGVSREARQAADFVIFLDRTPFLCALRAINRNIPYLFKSRPGLPDGCTEIKILPYLMKLIFQFESKVKPYIVENLSGRPHVTLKTDGEISEFLSEITHSKHKLMAFTRPICNR